MDTLPDEINQQILSFCTSWDTIRAREVCRAFNKYHPLTPRCKIVNQFEYKCMDIKFIKKHPKFIDWEKLSKTSLSESFIEEFWDKLDWRSVSRYAKLSEDFMIRNSHRVNWRMIARYQTLSETFIKQFANSIDWNGVSRYQKLRPKFIWDYRNWVNWKLIFKYQDIPIQELQNMLDKM